MPPELVVKTDLRSPRHAYPLPDEELDAIHGLVVQLEGMVYSSPRVAEVTKCTGGTQDVRVVRDGGAAVVDEEARRLADEALEPLRSLSYEQLLAEYFKKPHASEVKGHDGQEYNLEVEAMWDSRKQRTLRVFACVDDGTLRWGSVSSG